MQYLKMMLDYITQWFIPSGEGKSNKSIKDKVTYRPTSKA
jgi:hypothetical protein